MKRALLIVFVSALVLAGCAATQPPQRYSPVRDIDLRAWQWGYEPGLIQFYIGQKIRLHVSSLDVAHRITCSEIGLDAEIPARGSNPAVVEFSVEKPGEYVVHCSDPKCGPGQSRMRLRMVVLH
jgi:heme/copper-type cytochrome/quinol oxidase subunit 2